MSTRLSGPNSPDLDRAVGQPAPRQHAPGTELRTLAETNQESGVRRSAFGVRRSAFGVRRSAFGVRRSAFGVRRSA
ncbi:hypothetical protein ABZ348_07845, partial [Streptomyces sp. NPDC005963]|uniref:hypothetical protein n=1 Tax=Streptomyces sp. NPDC005963 TaxID=3156721 RepID=UPI0033C209B7